MFLNIHYFPSQFFFNLEEILFENYFNISENNMISVELAKLLRYSWGSSLSWLLCVESEGEVVGLGLFRAHLLVPWFCPKHPLFWWTLLLWHALQPISSTFFSFQWMAIWTEKWEYFLANLNFFSLIFFVSLRTRMAKVMNYLDRSGYSDLIISHVHVVIGLGTKIANNC
jgi:hypothetical protein